MKSNQIIAILALACVAGCDKSPDQGHSAALASANGLMPAGAPTFEEAYVVDQAQVKTAPKRTVSYEPFAVKGGGAAKTEVVEEKPAEKPTKKHAAKSVTPKSAAAPAANAKAASHQPAAAPKGSGSFWKNVGLKALTGGGAAGQSGSAKPAKEAGPQGDKPKASSDKGKPASGKAKAGGDTSKKAASKDKEKKEGGEEEDNDEEESDDSKEDSKDDDSGG